jgi:diguanylate cyclase (GGDEF)-like protein
MKIARPEGAGGTRRAAGAYRGGAGMARALSPVPGATPLAASQLGIPEQEYTPRVRDAIQALMAEVDRLRKEADDIRVRLDEAARTADQDTLVPLLNRRAFVREIARFIGFAARYGTPSSLVYIDLDEFKCINDAHGHAAGDAVLRHIADVVVRQVRDTDVVARIGGDEFGIVLAHVNLPQAEKKAAALDRALRQRPLVYNGHTLALGFSFGTYELRAGESADSAIARADEAMYAQKRAR